MSHKTRKKKAARKRIVKIILLIAGLVDIIRFVYDLSAGRI